MFERAPAIEFRAVGKRFADDVTALAGVSFTVPAAAVTALMGGSGSGKTTLLRLVNRMETVDADAGAVLIDGVDTRLLDPIRLRRAIGYVMQEGGLFPHWTAERNVALVPGLTGIDHARSEALVSEAMALARIPRAEFGRRHPGTLSGGQRQRVALARAIAARPRLLLLDEPFGALDPAVRAELQEELRSLVRRLRLTVLLVTHDIAEAFAVADRIVLIDRGRVVQVGTPAEIALAPLDDVAAAFTLQQGLELRLRHLRLADVARHLAGSGGTAAVRLPGDGTVADALAALAEAGAEHFTVACETGEIGPFERRAVWDLLQRRAAGAVGRGGGG